MDAATFTHNRRFVWESKLRCTRPVSLPPTHEEENMMFAEDSVTVAVFCRIDLHCWGKTAELRCVCGCREASHTVKLCSPPRAAKPCRLSHCIHGGAPGRTRGVAPFSSPYRTTTPSLQDHHTLLTGPPHPPKRKCGISPRYTGVKRILSPSLILESLSLPLTRIRTSLMEKSLTWIQSSLQ